jgi:addiction module RelE/StbE family toxin
MANRSAIRWTKSAEDDVGDIIDYFKADSPIAAFDVMERIRERTSHLADAPLAGRYVPELYAFGYTNYREIIVKPWRIIYRIDGKTVYVILVIDSRRNVEDVILTKLLR